MYRPEDDPKIPKLGTAAGRERLSRSKHPLDSWVPADFESPEYQAAQLARMRRNRRTELIVGWTIGLALLGGAIFTAVTDDGPPVDADPMEYVGAPR